LVGCCAEFLFSRARPCVCAQRTPIVDSEKFSEVANIALFFNDNNTIAYKGNADLASVTFTQAIFSFTFVKGTGGASGTAPEVVVKGVGFDTTVKYQCVFKLGNSQKVSKTTLPTSSDAINCGSPPDLIGGSYTGEPRAKALLLPLPPSPASPLCLQRRRGFCVRRRHHARIVLLGEVWR